MIDEKWEDGVLTLSKHKLLEALEKLNKNTYNDNKDIEAYKNTLKALYYLLSIEKAK